MAHGNHAGSVVLIAKPRFAGQRAERKAAVVLRALVFAAAEKDGNLGFVMATHGSLAQYCSLTVKQVRLALSRLEAGDYIVKQRCPAGLGIVIPHFTEQRRCFDVVDDPAITDTTPEGMLPSAAGSSRC